MSGAIPPPLYAFMAWTGQLRFVQSFSNIVTHSNALLQTGRRERGWKQTAVTLQASQHEFEMANSELQNKMEVRSTDPSLLSQNKKK